MGGEVYKATGFTLESLGVKQQCLHCCREVKFGGHVNILNHSEHRECIWDNFPAGLYVSTWRMQQEGGSYSPQVRVYCTWLIKFYGTDVQLSSHG